LKCVSFIAILKTAVVTGYPLDVHLLCGKADVFGAATKQTLKFVMTYKSYFAVCFCACIWWCLYHRNT